MTAQAPEGCSPEPAGRPLEHAGDDVPRWMVAHRRSNPSWTGPGLQVDSSVACAIFMAEELDIGPWFTGRSHRFVQYRYLAHCSAPVEFLAQTIGLIFTMTREISVAWGTFGQAWHGAEHMLFQIL